MSQGLVTLKQRSFLETYRRDMWWIQPAITVTVLLSFIVYSTWAAFQGEHYYFAGYLSPFYSPELFGPSSHSWFGDFPSWWPEWMPRSAALLILWAPAGFRFTCYYYRGAYYKAFWADPLNCAVGEPRKSYLGENSLPLILQNVHRYFLYIALAFLFLLAHDAWKGMWFLDPVTGKETFGIGVGSLVLWLNVYLLSSYTLGCHSFRHIVGGFLDEISRSPARKKCYDCVTCLNQQHMRWAWCSLIWVAFTDVYVRLCSMGIWTDYRLF